ncbi:hypothetical protein AV530_014494 [Patagioenas fasciata monilis]|uniref:Uncharacterized protein n=1 Tax=Patagioenas fasciata monilis TaxID=372326 RepID=A0A1V4KC45_PATFA|nr:hypothetical protein AV530_014494 [Patagioenas fasciata monilis]
MHQKNPATDLDRPLLGSNVTVLGHHKSDCLTEREDFSAENSPGLRNLPWQKALKRKSIESRVAWPGKQYFKSVLH